MRLGSGSQDRALERLRSAVEIDPKLWEAWYDIGWLERDRHRPVEAAAAFEKAAAINPTHAPTIFGLVEAYLAAGRADEAIRVGRGYLDAAPKRTPPPANDEVARVRIALSRAQRRAGKLDDATETLRQILRLDGRSADALEGLGLVYYQRAQLELAELVTRRALEIREKADHPRATAETYNNLGLIALAARRDQEAFAHFDHATRLDPAASMARRNKAIVYLDCGDYARAVDELKKATEIDPTDVDAWTALGVAQRGAGAMADAEKAYQRALALDPAAADSLYNLGILYSEWKKHPAHAEEYLKRFLEVAPAKHPRKKDAEDRVKDLAARGVKPAK